MRRPDPIEQRNDELHRRVAELIRRDPSVVDRARKTLQRWIDEEPLPAWMEWESALRMLDADELAAFLESPTPRARRMRSSSPFFCVARDAAETPSE